MITTTTDTHTHYAHPLVCWGPVLTGATVALVTGVMLNLLGTSLGFATVAATTAATDSLHSGADAAAGAGIAALVWMIIANLLATAFGAWIAARVSSHPDHHRGALQGVAVWAVTSLVVLVLTASSFAGATSTMLNSAALASGTTIAREADRGTLHESSVKNVDQAQAEAQARLDQNRPEDREATIKATGATSAATMGAFIAMLAGLFAAIFGARAGAKHPDWHNRPVYQQTYQTRP